MALPPKICPRCGEEYVHTTSTCAHCEVPLVLEGDLSLEREGAGEPLPPSSELVCVRTAGAAWALRLSERLAADEVPHRVEPVAEPRGAFGIYVREADVEAAAAADREHLAREMPDLPSEHDLAPADDEGCPACGAALAADATACDDCGLPFAPAE